RLKRRITSRMTAAMIHPRTRKPRRRRWAVGTRIGCEAYCRGSAVPCRALRRSVVAALFVHHSEQAPASRVCGRELLPRWQPRRTSRRLERVVVGIRALTLLGGDPAQPWAFGSRVVHAARVDRRREVNGARVRRLPL